MGMENRFAFSRLRVFVIACVVVVAAAAAEAQQIDYACLRMPVEMRGIWIDAGAIPKTGREVRELVRTYHRAGLNTLFPESVMRGYTIYSGGIIERDPRFAGAPDVLAIMIDEAHRLGMEVHPWVWVFRVGYSKDIGSILRVHPNWAAANKNGETLSPNGGYWLSACNPQARDLLANLLAELLSRYDVDGIHLDYIRYEVEKPVPYDYGDACRAEFERQYAIDPMDIDPLTFHQYEWNKFRERQINTFVQRIALLTRFIRPDAKISAAVAPNPEQARLQYMQNWVNWAQNKWVDFLVPMSYSSTNDYFAALVEQDVDAAGRFTLLMPGIGMYAHKDPTTTVQQIGIARNLITSGQVLFASSYLDQARIAPLTACPYRSTASQPFRDPWEKSLQITDHCLRYRQCSSSALADFFGRYAGNLAEYAKYREQKIPYIPPTLPPLNVPEDVLPLPVARIPPATLLVRVDGVLDDPAWTTAARAQLSYTAQGAPAPVQTTAYLAYDPKYLYIGFRAAEPMIDKIRATVSQRDGPVFQDDSVEVFLAPAKNRENYYHLAVNTLGTKYDANDQNASWNGDWQAVAKVEADGYAVEIAVPFETLGAQAPDQSTEWGLNLTRNRTVTGETEHLTWAVPYGSFHTPYRFGAMVLDEAL